MQPTINIKPRLMRPNSFGNQTTTNPFVVNNNPNVQRPPISQNYQNRPASHSQHTHPVQSHIFMPQSNMYTSQRQLKLLGMARVVSQKQEHATINIPQEQHNTRSYEKPSQGNRNYFNQYASNSIGKYPLNKSVFISKCQDSFPLKQHKNMEKHISQSIGATPPQQNKQIPVLKFSSIPKPSNLNSQRLNKTDRVQPTKRFPVDNFFTNRNEAPSKTEQKPKNTAAELDSTIHTETTTFNEKQKKQFLEVPNSDNYIIGKNFSPSNLWPLSISPSQQKRQTVFYDPFLGVEPQKKLLTGSPDLSIKEFKKKKNFQFFNNLKRKQSSQELKSPKKWSMDDFELLDKIGKGSFGDVYMAQQKATGFVCVIKKLLKKKLIDNNLEEQLMRQIKIQAYLDHRHLTPLYGFFNDEKFIYIILEFMPDGSLMQVKKKRKIPESQVSFYVRQICLGLKYMHTENIIHRDIKPENIFLYDNYAKIGDFGCSIHSLTLRTTQIGSFAYVSPEQLKLESYNEKIDVWSVGVITYEMLYGVAPFEADIIQIAKQQKAPQFSELKFPATIEISPEAKNFLIGMLNLDPNERLGIDEAIRHEFILKYLRNEDPGITS